MQEKMKVEIWSDIVCPFCYIGKRNFEKALGSFPQKNQIEIEWKSFQLAPDMQTVIGKSPAEHLAESKGISIEDAMSMNKSVTERAREVGLEFNYDKAITANTMKAHMFSHFAKKYGKQNEAEELLFRSYFTDGKNIDDIHTLLDLAKELDLDTAELKPILETDLLHDTVREDIYEASQLGVRGVPFFVFDRKYAISGAQPVAAFTETLQKAFSEWESVNQSTLQVNEGDSCSDSGDCF